MQAPCEATLLQILLRDDDVFDGKPLCDLIVRQARAAGLSGATAVRGFLGYGPTLKEPDARFTDDVPIVIQIVDTEESIRRFLPTVDSMLGSGLVTLQRVSVLRFGRVQRPAGA